MARPPAPGPAAAPRPALGPAHATGRCRPTFQCSQPNFGGTMGKHELVDLFVGTFQLYGLFNIKIAAQTFQEKKRKHGDG